MSSGTLAPAARWRLGARLRALRAFSLPVSVLPVLAAVATTGPSAAWNVPVLIASIVGVAALHLVGNLLNDYFDFHRGVDRLRPDDAGRPGRQLVRGELTLGDILVEAAVCLALATAAAAYLTARLGPGVIAFAAPAAIAAYAYTGPPFSLKYRALGEPLVFAVFGPLLMAGAAWAQTGRIEPAAILMSVPIGLATTAILVGNNWRDRAEDGLAGVRTLGQFLAGRVARVLYVALVAAAAGLPAVYAAVGVAPRALLAAPLTLALLARPLVAVKADRRMADIDARTARFETVLMLLFIAAWILHPR